MLMFVTFLMIGAVAAYSVEEPLRNVRLAKFEVNSLLNCEVNGPKNLIEILWLLNGEILCERTTHDYAKCSQDRNTTYNEDSNTYSRGLQLNNVLKNDTYTCVAVDVDSGRNWTVSETKVVVVPKDEFTTVRVLGSDDTIYCSVATPNLQVRLRRDGNTYCTASDQWCSKRNGIGGSYTFFDIKNMRKNHTFTCEVYTPAMRLLATASIHHFVIVPKTEILELTVSPAGPVPNGTELVATARFQSSFGWPVRRWKLDGEPIENQDEMIFLYQNVYRSNVSLGPIFSSSIITLEVVTNYGSDTKEFKVRVVDSPVTTTPASWNSTYTSKNVTSATTTPPAGGRPIYIKDSVFNILNIFISP